MMKTLGSYRPLALPGPFPGLPFRRGGLIWLVALTMRVARRAVVLLALLLVRLLAVHPVCPKQAVRLQRIHGFGELTYGTDC